MRPITTIRARMALCALAFIPWAAPVAAQSTAPNAYPNKPITLLHAYSPGGSSAVLLRALAELAGKSLGQRMVVEDRPGAGGALAPTHMLKSGKADGYILSQLPQPLLRIPHIQKTEFDVLNDFTWIIRVVDYTYAMVVKPDAPWKNVTELVKHAQANPGKLTYATSGVGVTMHMAMENLATLTGVKWVHAPHRQTTDMMNAVIGGQVDIMSSAISYAPLVEAGKIRVLAILGANRVKRWPHIPTVKEQGYDVNASSSYGIGGPRGMDPKIVKLLHDTFRKGLDDPEFLKLLDRYDTVKSYMNTEDYTRWAREQYAVEKTVVEKFGLKP
jgi:tripartite-type tricarboxylate transporter receptor subunit TctC